MAGISDKAIKGQYIENKYRYNGKELQHQEFSDGTGLEEYDYEARMMDPQLGMWHGIDLLAEKYAQFSPYNYTINNPLKFKDPNGMGPYGTDGPNDPTGSSMNSSATCNCDLTVETSSGSVSASGGNSNQNKGRSKKSSQGKSSSSNKSNDAIITSLRLRDPHTGRTWDQRIADVPEGYEEHYVSLFDGGNVSWRSFKFTPLTSAMYEAGVSGLYYEVRFFHFFSPNEDDVFNFQPVYVEFPSETKDGRLYSPQEAAMISAKGFQEAITSVALAVQAMGEEKVKSLDSRTVQNMFTAAATFFISEHINAAAIVTNRKVGKTTITMPVIWGP